MKQIFHFITLATCLGSVSAFLCVSGIAAEHNEDECYDPTEWFDFNNNEYDDTLSETSDAWTSGGTRLSDEDTDNKNLRAAPESEREYSGTNPAEYRNTPETASNNPGASNYNVQRKTGQKAGQRTVLRGVVKSYDSRQITDRYGAGSSHAIVEMEWIDGRTSLVDFRPGFLEKVQIEQGDEIVIRGQNRKMGGRTVLRADQVRLNGKTFTYRQNPTRRSNAFFSGRVEDFKEVQVAGSPGRTFLEIWLENGRSAVVDIGSHTDLSDLDLNVSEPITVRGQWDRVQGRRVLKASQFWVAGERTDLE